MSISNLIFTGCDFTSRTVFFFRNFEIHFLIYVLDEVNYTFPNFLLSGCTCNAEGSENTACDTAGKCTCKANVIGRDCDSCEEGYYGFPDCQGKFFKNFDQRNQIQAVVFFSEFLDFHLEKPDGFGILVDFNHNSYGIL